MEYYYEYVIRCKACNNTIDHLRDEFEEGLANGNNMSEVLNSLRLYDICCRNAMMNPYRVELDSQYSDVVNGKQLDNTTKLSFIETEEDIVFEEKEIDIPVNPKIPTFNQQLFNKIRIRDNGKIQLRVVSGRTWLAR